MKNIKFSHTYSKFPINVRSGSEVKLIEVIDTKFEHLCDTFKEYDTTFYNGGNYNLPMRGECLILLFLGDGAIKGQWELFTTVCRSTPSKKQYYKSLRGQRLIVKIGGE